MELFKKNNAFPHSSLPYSFTLVLFYLCWASSATSSNYLNSTGSCKASRKCCDGKDADCIVQTSFPGSIEDSACYCDHGCLSVGDCCGDFKEYCGVLDCEVGQWSEWSKCDVSCGTGTLTRTREIQRPESNGGLQCPLLEERRSCKGLRCSKTHLDKISAHGETAMLLPGKYAQPQGEASKDDDANSKYDVRSNLKSYHHRVGKQYCVIFQVEKAMGSCLSEKDTASLKTGNSVCVMCNDKAQRSNLGGRCTGHGVEEKLTRFKSILTFRCHGKWKRIDLIEDECPCPDGPDFIFV